LCAVSPAASPRAWRRGRRRGGHGRVTVSSCRAGELAAADPVIRLASECGDFAHISGVATDSCAEAAAEEREWAGVSAGRAMHG
jgi:hypothetical protein